MIVQYKDFLRDLDELSYRDIPDCRPIKQIMFNDEDDIKSLNENISHILLTFRGQAFIYCIILILYSLYQYDNNMIIGRLWGSIRYIEQIRYTEGEFSYWLSNRLDENNGDLSSFMREYNRYKLTHPPLSFEDS